MNRIEMTDLQNIGILPVIVLLFAIVHTAKLLRLYLIMIDEKIPLRRFALYYCLTTLVNLVIPFKLGEFFRIGVFARATKSFRIGVLSVLLDRFFDTVALVLILLPFELLSGRRVSNATLMLAVFVVVAVFVYASFCSFYLYLNRYTIMNRSSKNAMNGLKMLETLKTGYDYVKHLIDGRYALLTIASFLAWLLECGILYFLSVIGNEAGKPDISAYIGAIISTEQDVLMREYVTLSILLMGIAALVCLLVLWIHRGRKMKRKEATYEENDRIV